MSGLSGCVTRYQSSQIDLIPSYISKETIDWCGRHCPTYVRKDLMECQSNAIKQSFRNDSDETIITENMTDKMMSIVGKVWNYII